MRTSSTRFLLLFTLALAARATPALAVCGNAVIDPGEQCDVTAQAGQIACPGACIPPGFSGQCACASPATSITQYAAVVERRLHLGTGAGVLFGGVAVTEPGGLMLIGRRAFMASSSHAVADRARVAGGAEIGRLFANLAAVNPTAELAGGGPFRFPVPLFVTDIPAFPPLNPGTVDIAVPEGGTLVLAPAAYGRVVVQKGATLILAGFSPGSGAGTYQLEALRLIGTARATAHNPVVLNIATHLGVGGGGFLGPASFAPAIAGDVEVNFGGRAARIKGGATVTAHLLAPNGSIGIAPGAIVTGLLIGDSLSTSRNVLITRQGGCGDGMREPGEECDTSAAGGDAACPGQCIPGDPQSVGRVAHGQRGQCTCRCTSNAECADGDACNGTETCDAGVCTRSLPPNCNDNNPCTRDCDPAVGCVNTPVTNGTSCSDGNTCTLQDSCQGGTCIPGPTRNCDDTNSCTTDGCDPAEGCTHTAHTNGSACTDGNACTTPDACQNGACIGPPVNCDDANPCTAESCDAQAGCGHTPLPNGTPCGPGLTCVFGSCQ